MGDMVLQKIHGSDFKLADPIVDQYLQELATKFNAHINLPNFKLHFFGVDTSELNAFAFFGANVAVHSGLILAVNTESELAAVLAHETAHISQHHLSRMVATNRQMMPLTIVELLAALAIGIGSPEAGIHLAHAALAGHMQNMINFTREHEQEADRMGMQLLVKTNFDPNGMAGVFQHLRRHTGYQTKAPEYLMTHPVFDSRIADAQNRALSLGTRKVSDSLFFHLVRARLEVSKYENTHKKITRLQDKHQKGRFQNKTAAQYAIAIAHIKNHHPQKAIPLLQELLKAHPNEWVIELSLAKAESKANLIQQALARTERLMKIYPSNYAILSYHTGFLLQNKQPDKVVTLLITHKRNHMRDPFLHEMMARAYSMIGEKVALHRAQAECHFAKGQFREAFKQLEVALEYTKNKDPVIRQIKERRNTMQAIIQQQKGLKI